MSYTHLMPAPVEPPKPKSKPAPENDNLSGLLAAGLDPVTQGRIEAAVLDIFSAQEFHHVSLIDVAKHANVSLQTIYKYYGSKERLLYSSLDSWMSQLMLRVKDHLQGIETYKDKLRKVVWLSLDFFERNPKVAQLILSSVYMNTWRKDETFKQRAVNNLMLQLLSDGIREGMLTDEVDEIMLLDMVYGALSRVVTMWMFRGQDEPLAEKAGPLFNLLWRAMVRQGVG